MVEWICNVEEMNWIVFSNETFLWFQMIYAYETPEPAETKTPREKNRHSPEKNLLSTTTKAS